MSDIATADKVEYPGTGTPSAEQVFSPADYNEIKTAVNSKQDKNKMVQDFTAPDTVTFPSTQAVADLVGLGNAGNYKGEISGDEDLNDVEFAVSGFWTPDHPFDATGNTSYPTGLNTKKPLLVAYAKNEVVVQILYILSANSTSYSKQYFRSFDPNVGSGEWGKWTEVATYDRMVTDLSSPNNTTFPTTKAVGDLIDFTTTMKLRGVLLGNEDLDAKLSVGFWVPSPEFEQDNASFPTDHKGIFEILVGNGFVLQRYTVISETDGAVSAQYHRTGLTAGVWGSWVKLSGTPIDPPSSAVTDSVNYVASIAAGSRDHAGKLTIQRSGGESPAIWVKVTVTLAKETEDIVAVLLAPASEIAFNNKWYVDSISDTQFVFFIGGDIADGEDVSFYYSTHKK